jgi:CRP-like cAMP-binding protein
MVIEKTHGPIIEKISFFKQKNDINKNFTTQIIYELKNMNLQNGELLYQQNDMPEQMYFLFQGRFKLLVDLNAFIKDEKIFVELQKREQLRKKMQKDKEGADEEEGLDVNPNFAAVIQYVEGSYFGDADYFAFATNLDKRGRDTSA